MQRVALKMLYLLATSSLQKNNNDLPKVAQWAKNDPIWSPCSAHTTLGMTTLEHQIFNVMLSVALFYCYAELGYAECG